MNKMKKKILAVMMVAIFVSIISTNMRNSQKIFVMSDISLANVEALADDEHESCFNVCMAGNGGCFCYQWYSYLKEVNW